jgi:hypothetical protein
MTTLGLHTVADVSDLLRAKDYEVERLDSAFKAYTAAWAAKDPTALSDWRSDWVKLQARYSVVKAAALANVGLNDVANPLPSSMIQDESDYQAILRSLNRH